MNLTGTLNYEYILNDHLGNNRLNFDRSGGAVAKQQQDYYPFGLEIARRTTPSTKNEYLYNKKELQEELVQYDYGASRHNLRGELPPISAPGYLKANVATNKEIAQNFFKVKPDLKK